MGLYCKRSNDADPEGPHEVKDIRSAIAAGELSPDVLVSTLADGPWVRASTCDGLDVVPTATAVPRRKRRNRKSDTPTQPAGDTFGTALASPAVVATLLVAIGIAASVTIVASRAPLSWPAQPAQKVPQAAAAPPAPEVDEGAVPQTPRKSRLTPTPEPAGVAAAEHPRSTFSGPEKKPLPARSPQHDDAPSSLAATAAPVPALPVEPAGPRPLSADEARTLVAEQSKRFKVRDFSLEVSHAQITAEAAVVISGFGVERASRYPPEKIRFARLSSLSAEVASALAQSEAMLLFDNIHDIDPAAARAIAHHRGPSMSFPLLERATEEAVEALAEYKGDLHSPIYGLVANSRLPATQFKKGRPVDAEFSSLDGDSVTVRLQVNEYVKVRLSSLSPQDREYALKQANGFPNSIGMQFRRIPADDSQSRSAESPFWIGAYEVTCEQWYSVMPRPEIPRPERNDRQGLSSPADEQTALQQLAEARRITALFTDKRPAPVKWQGADEFCVRLSELPAEKAAGRKYRLPTNAEWEYACRAGASTKYSFGDDRRLLGEYAWYDENSGGTLHPVGQKRPNAFGLFDMHGNANEWVSDWYEKPRMYQYAGGQEKLGGGYRFSRGGDAWSSKFDCESSKKKWGVRIGGPDQLAEDGGFRLVLEGAGDHRIVVRREFLAGDK